MGAGHDEAPRLYKECFHTDFNSSIFHYRSEGFQVEGLKSVFEHWINQFTWENWPHFTAGWTVEKFCLTCRFVQDEMHWHRGLEMGNILFFLWTAEAPAVRYSSDQNPK